MHRTPSFLQQQLTQLEIIHGIKPEIRTKESQNLMYNRHCCQVIVRFNATETGNQQAHLSTVF